MSVKQIPDYPLYDYINKNSYVYISSDDGKSFNIVDRGGDFYNLTEVNNEQPIGTIAEYGDNSSKDYLFNRQVSVDPSNQIILLPVSFNLDYTFYNIHINEKEGNNLIVILDHLGNSFDCYLRVGNYTVTSFREEVLFTLLTYAGINNLDMEYSYPTRRWNFKNKTAQDFFFLLPSFFTEDDRRRRFMCLKPLGLIENNNSRWRVIKGNNIFFVSPTTIDLRRTNALKILVNFGTNSIQSNNINSSNQTILFEIPVPYIEDVVQTTLKYEAPTEQLTPKVLIPNNSFGSMDIIITDANNNLLLLQGGGYSGVIKTEILPRINLNNQQFEVKDTIAYRFPPPNRISLLKQFLNHLEIKKSLKRKSNR